MNEAKVIETQLFLNSTAWMSYGHFFLDTSFIYSGVKVSFFHLESFC
jgi:hypothetical protein